MDNVKYEITKLNPCKLKLKIIVEKPLVEQIYNNCCKQLQKGAQLPGFRKGAVPIDLIKKFYTKQLNTLFIQNLVEQTLPEILKENKINYISDSLRIYSTNFQTDNACSYEVELETEPEVKLKSYKGLKLKKEIRKVTQADIDKTLQQLKENNAKLLPSIKTFIDSSDILPTSNIFCVINFKIFVDGKELKQYEGKNVLIDLSLETLPKGLKEGLVQMKVGDKKSINVEFPVNTPQVDLMGKQAVIEVELLEIKEKKLPNIDDEFAKDLGYKNLDDLISEIKQRLQQEFDKEANEKLRNEIYKILLQEHNFVVPETEVEKRQQEIVNTLKQDFQLRTNNKEEFKLTEEQQKQIRKKAEDEVKLKYILKKILQEEKIELTKELLEKERGKLLSFYPGREKEINEYFEKNIDVIASNILEDKIFDLIVSTAKIKEVDITK